MSLADTDAKGNPSLEHEVLRRAAENDMIEMWFFLSSQLKHLRKDVESTDRHSAINRLDYILNTGADHQRYSANSTSVLSFF